MVVCRLWASSGEVLVIWLLVDDCWFGGGGGLLLHLGMLLVASVAAGLGVIFLHMGWIVSVVALVVVVL